MKFNIACNCLLYAPVDQLGVGGPAAAAAAAAPVDMRRSTAQISNNFVSESSSGHTYIPKLVLFLLWVFDTHRNLISPVYLAHFDSMNRTDTQNHAVLQQRRRTGTGRVPIASIKNPRANLRNSIRTAIETTPPTDGVGRHNSPIKIDGEGALTHQIILEYMQTNMREVWVDRGSAEAYMEDIHSTRTISDEMVNDSGQVLCQVYQSPSQYTGIRSALSYLYKLARVTQPDELVREVGTFMQGMERGIRSAKEKLGLKISEGKKPLSFKGYSMMAKKLFESPAKEDVFAHLFLVLDWCLMKRAENCVSAKINHISFRDDCLVFEFAKSKGHQKGEEHVGPWHVYANPMIPWICPVLALARYLLCYPETLKGDVSLFPGKAKSVYNRYNDRFNVLKKKLKVPLERLGYGPGDLGTHSVRKGVGSMVAAGCTVSPPIVALCIRAGWTLGGVKDKYLFRENAGDQYVGRCASGLDQTTKEFAVSPPYFDYSKFEGEERIVAKRKYRVGLVQVNTKRWGPVPKLRVLPPNYQFPAMTPPQLIDHWFVGNVKDNIPPFCTLDGKQVNHMVGDGGATLRKMRRFMRFTVTMAKKKGCWGDRDETSPVGWDIAATRAVWDGIKKGFYRKYYAKNCRRKAELSWGTPYNKMKNRDLIVL